MSNTMDDDKPNEQKSAGPQGGVMSSYAADDPADDGSRVTVLCALGNIFLSAFKIILGYLAASSALVADGIHSLSDLITDGVVLAGVKMSSRPSDESHPYGHGKYETLAAVAVASALIIVGVGIIRNAISNEPNSPPSVHFSWVIAASAVSLALKEFMFRYTRAAARRLNSTSMLANAWHHRSDAMSSVVVLASGVLGEVGLPGFDHIAAVLVGVMIVIVGMNIALSNTRQLTEAAADKKTIGRIRELVAAVPGVKGFHRLRTRYVGRELFIDVHVNVDSDMTVRAGHRVATEIEQTISDKMMIPANILVHIEPDEPSETAVF